jgi:multiple sugar transport system substrate-binding protein
MKLRIPGRAVAVIIAVAALAAIVAGCGSGAHTSTASVSVPTTLPSKLPNGKITVLYSNNYVFNSDSLAKRWWDGIAKQWAQKYPNVKLNLVGTGGTDVDEMNKAALLFRSSSTAPDVVQLPTTYISQFGGSGFLLDLDKFVANHQNAPFWSNFPKAVQDMGRYNNKLYAINDGNNDSAIVYNKTILAKAGIKMPWQPKTWNDIVTAAKAVKASQPKVYPLWLAAGVAAGPTNVLQGSGNLIYGTKTPAMYDPSTKKWVVDSPGIRSTLNFYKQIYSQGLGAPTSELFRPDSVGRPPLLFKNGQLAIAIGSNWYPTVWVNPASAAPWKAGLKDVGIAPVPTENGQGPGTSTLGGWAWAIGSASKNPLAAWAFIKLAETPNNLLTTALWSGFVPPDTTVGQLHAFTNYAPPFQAAFNDYQKFGEALPTDQNFPVYARALNTATGMFAQHPSTSVQQALNSLKSGVTQQLGSTKVETQGG